MAKQSTLSRSTRLLLEGGTLADDAVARLVGARDLVLSRAICRFKFYRAPQTLSSSQFAQAARVFGEAHAPFADSGMLILRSGAGAGIWYWDRSKLAAFKPVGEVSPESLWREPGDGWRVVACAEGYEAQYWEAGALMATTWRRQPFAAPQWTAFTLSVDSASVAPPAEPPAAIALPMLNRLWRSAVVRPPLGWRDVERAGVSIGIVAAAVAALFVGQALRSDQIAHREQARAAAIEQALREDRDIARAMDQRLLLREYASATAHPQILLGVAEAQEVLHQFGLRAGTWRGSDDGLSLIVEAAISDAPVRDIVAAMEATAHLCGVVPEIAGVGRFEIRAELASASGVCGSTAEDGRT